MLSWWYLLLFWTFSLSNTYWKCWKDAIYDCCSVTLATNNFWRSLTLSSLCGLYTACKINCSIRGWFTGIDGTTLMKAALNLQHPWYSLTLWHKLAFPWTVLSQKTYSALYNQHYVNSKVVRVSPHWRELAMTTNSNRLSFKSLLEKYNLVFFMFLQRIVNFQMALFLNTVQCYI